MPSLFTVRFACGATYGPSDLDPCDGGREDQYGKIRLAVYDTDTGIDRPQLNGANAPCRFNCPAKARASGRKLTQCWPEQPPPPGDRPVTRWRYVVTCRGVVEVTQ